MVKKGFDYKSKGKDADNNPADLPGKIKENVLLNELESLEKTHQSLQQQLTELHEEREWLEREAGRVRLENREYMSYLDKKVEQRRANVISLSEQNRSDVENINRERRQLESQFLEEKEELQRKLLVKEEELQTKKNELEALGEYKAMQDEQLAKIESLARELQERQRLHSQQMHEVKEDFLQQKKQLEETTEVHVSEMARQANKEAMSCLAEHTGKVKQENRELRSELLQLIQKTRSLQQLQDKLELQKRQLSLEQKHMQKMQDLKKKRRTKILK